MDVDSTGRAFFQMIGASLRGRALTAGDASRITAREGRIVRRFHRVSCNGRICIVFFVLSLFGGGAVAVGAQDVEPKPSTKPQAAPGLAVGSFVILKNWNTLLNHDGRLVPLGRYFVLTVERIDGDRVSVASPNGSKLGSVGIDQLLLRDQAIDYFDREIAKDPRNADAYWMRARLRLTDPDRAANDLDRAIQLAPNRARYHLVFGDIHLDKGQLDLAIANFDKAIQIDPGMATAFLRRATARAMKGEVQRMKPDLDEAIRLDPTDYLAWSGRYAYWMHQRNLENALKDITEVIRLDAKNPVWHLWRGDIWTRMGKLDQALVDFTEATRLQPNYDFALSKRGIALRALGRYDEAIADFTEAIKLDPKVTWFFVRRGDVWIDKTELEKAIADYSAAIGLEPNKRYAAVGLDPGKDEIYLKRAAIWAKKHDRSREVADYTEAIKLDPKNAFNRLMRAYAWSRQGDHTKAIADFDEAIRIAPMNAGYFTSQGFEWAKDLEPQKALADFNRALELDPKDTFAYLGRSNVWEMGRDYDRMAGNFNEMVRMIPENPRGHRELAWLLATCPVAAIRDGKRAVAEATVACESTRRKDPDCIDTLAAACAEAKDFDAAVKWETQAIEMLTAQGPDQTNFRKEFAMRDRLSLYERRQPYHQDPDKARP
jgi:tetratricopeptide (TPR) repeat protein